MPGPFDNANPPARSGAYVNWSLLQAAAIDPPQDGIVVVPFTHDWGPFKTLVPCDSFGEWQSVYGRSMLTPGYRAVRQAFKGEAVGGYGGAKRVLAYRTGGSSAAKASKTLQNTTPANAITLTARYEGTFGNGLKVEVVANSADPTNKHDMVIYNGSQELERYTYAKTDINSLATTLANSDWVVSSSVTSGVALSTTVSGGVSFTGGDDGSTLVSGDWTAILTAVGTARFDVFAPFDLQDSSIIASVQAWAAAPGTGLNNKGSRFSVVFGGTTTGSDSMSNALTRAAGLNNENLDVVGGFTYTDEDIVDSNGNKVTLTASQAVPRIAGIIAARGEAQSITFGRLGGVELVSAPTDAEVVSAIQGGVITLARDSNQIAPVRIERGVTSYVSDTTTKPKKIYGNLKYVKTMQGLEMDIQRFSEDNIIGRLAVNAATREYLVGAAKALVKQRVEANIIQALNADGSPAYDVFISTDPPPSDDDDFIALTYLVKFERSLEQIRNTIQVG